MLGNLITLASAVLTISPKNAKSSFWRWESVKFSGKAEIMRPAREISRTPTFTLATAVKACTIGRSDAEASCGASSTLVKIMSG